MAISRASMVAAALASATLLQACAGSRFCPDPAPVGPFGAPADAKPEPAKPKPQPKQRAAALNPCISETCKTQCLPENPSRPKWCALHEMPR